jgi:ABC-type branched-subunit amino acid transport system ATPase component
MDITKFFGGLGVLSDISLELGKRDCGADKPNGAGKTNFNVITGIYRPNRPIRLGGKDCGLKSHQICRAG